MTKDEPMAGVATCPPMMEEQDVEILRYNLDQPLTDQLVKHSRFVAPLENRPWSREMGDGGQHWENSDKQKYPSSNGYTASSSSSFEIMDLAMRKKPAGGGDVNSAARSNSERDNKRAFGCGATDKTGASGATATYNHHSAVQSSDFDNFYKRSPPVDYIPNGNGVKDLHKSEAAIMNRSSLSRGTAAKCSPMPALTTKAELSTGQSSLPPPLLRTSYDGGRTSGKMSAFQPVESHPRPDQTTVPALYKSHPYPYGLPPNPTGGLYDYPSISHHLLQPPEHHHHRSIIPAPLSSSQSGISAGSALSPYVLYSDNLMTHQLEVMYQRKYPNHPVPPVWMLYQYMDELLRDTSRVPPTRDMMNPVPPPSRVDSASSYKVASMLGSVPVGGTGAMPPTERKKMKKDQRERERERFGENKEVKASDVRNKEAFQVKPRNDGRDRKEWGKTEMERREAPPSQNGYAMDWHQHHLRQSQLDAHLHQQQQQQQQQRRELLVDESASSACDAVDQHFQESLLRLASSQNSHVNTSPRESAATGIIGQSNNVISRNRHHDDQIIIEKQENNLHGNGNHGSWKDGRYAKPTTAADQLHQQYRADDGSFSRLLSTGVTTQTASRNNNNKAAAPADCVSFDLYGYHPQTKDYGVERFHGAARGGDVCSSKVEKADDSRLQMYSNRQSIPTNYLERMDSGKKQQPVFPTAEPQGRDVKDTHHHQDLRNSFNASSAKGGGGEKRAPASSKLLNGGVNLSTGGQSVSSPIPGSVVKDSRLGPSRLIARSPKPLPNVFGNPLDSGFEPVQQVNIEPVERWTGSGSWAPSSSKAATDSYHRSGGFYMHPGFQGGATGFPTTTTETYSKIQQGLIPNPLYFPGMYELKQGGSYAGLPHRSSVPDFHHPLVKTSESRVMPGKPGKKEEDDVREFPTKRGNSVPRLSSFGSGDGDSPGSSQRPRIDSFKSFVEQAVYNAFIEDTEEGNGTEKISSMTKLIEDLEKERSARDALAGEGKNALTGCSSSASKLSSQPSPMSDKSATEAASLPGDLSKMVSDQPMSKVLLGAPPSTMDWCNGEPSRATCTSSSSVTTAASDLPDSVPIVAMDTRPPSSPAAHIAPSPPSFSLPPSPPRASVSSLHLKKAWLLRYSDNDQKPLSEASSSSFRDELDNQSSDCSKCSFTEKSPGESDLADIQPDVVSKVEGDGKNASSCASEDDTTPENVGSDAGKLKGLKRKATSETSRASCAKRARDSAASSPGRNNKSELLLNGHQDNRKTRSKYSTRLAKMTEQSAPSSPRVTASHDREQRSYDPKNTEENDDSCSPVQSDSETKTSRLRKKNKVNNDHKDSPDGRSTVQPKKTNPTTSSSSSNSSRIFLQDAACGEVDQRLTKCRECKAPQSQKNNPNTTNICKFYVFRKLQCYNKGSVSVAGFSEPSDAETCDIDLWMPLQSKNSHLTPIQAQYAIAHLKEYFLFLLEHETNSNRHKSNESDKSSGMKF